MRLTGKGSELYWVEMARYLPSVQNVIHLSLSEMSVAMGQFTPKISTHFPQDHVHERYITPNAFQVEGKSQDQHT